MSSLILGFVAATLLGSLVGGAIAIAASRDKRGVVDRRCPTCGSVVVVDVDPWQRAS